MTDKLLRLKSKMLCRLKILTYLLLSLCQYLFYTEPWTSTNWRLFLLIYSIVSSYTICK